MTDQALRVSDFRAMTFDCYGTLIDWEQGLLNGLASWRRRNSVPLTDGELLMLFSRIEPGLEEKYPKRLYSDILREVLLEMSKEIGCCASDDELEEFRLSIRRWPAFADSVGSLAYLKQHFRLVVISNVDRESFAYSNKILDVEFDAVITAEDVGSYKPNLENFHYALGVLKKKGIEKDRVLHVAQSLYHDHVPAKQLQLSSVWVNRRDGKPGTGATMPVDCEVKPDLIVRELADLVSIHRQESG